MMTLPVIAIFNVVHGRVFTISCSGCQRVQLLICGIQGWRRAVLCTNPIKLLSNTFIFSRQAKVNGDEDKHVPSGSSDVFGIEDSTRFGLNKL